jgi:gamma-D-glutamyl-L-lysine dipeptidyl-peptidase
MWTERSTRHAIAFALLLLASLASAQTDAQHYVITAPVANMYRTPSTDVDVVSQAIFSTDVVALEVKANWLKIRTPDQYTGWIPRANAKRQEGAKIYAAGKSAMVSSVFASVYREPDVEKHRPVMTIPFESRLEITGEKETPDGRWFSVRLPGGTPAWVQSGDVSLDNAPLSIEQTIALAKRFLGLPYRWGGTSSEGFDCSGFTQMLMRSRGVIMPRDTRPQANWDGLVPVERTQLLPGDLLYFGNAPRKINHTAMYIGNGEFINATRHEHPVVQIGRLDDAPWSTLFITARRLK